MQNGVRTILECSSLVAPACGGRHCTYVLLIYKAKIAHADWVGRHPDDPPAAKKSAAIGEKLRPAMPSLFNVEVAYEIAAYEYAKSQPKGFLGWAVNSRLISVPLNTRGGISGKDATRQSVVLMIA